MIVYNLIEVQKICKNADFLTLLDLQNYLMKNAPEIIFEFGCGCYRKMVFAQENAMKIITNLDNVEE